MQVVEQILDIFQRYRMSPLATDQYEAVGKDLLRQEITKFVIMNQVIQFVMLGFPFKSTNIRDKVIGVLPDLGELVTLQNFKKFNNEIKKVYEHGVNFNIISDGFIFNDILGVSDLIVIKYKEVSVFFGADSPVSWYDLNDFYSGDSLVEKRMKVVDQFGITPEKLQSDIMLNQDTNILYRGMILFMEQELAMKSFPSRNQLQKAAKELTRHMMFRNEAYSNLVKVEFADMIRLSMHPSVNSGAKYSFQLIPSSNARHSAWHSALVVNDNGEMSTMHRKDAIAAGHELVYKDGRPYYFHENKKENTL